MKPRLLDLCCGAGGCSVGYAAAGFDVTGVDIVHQPHYPFPQYIEDVLTWDDWDYDAIHFSPPCQLWTYMNGGDRDKAVDLYTPLLPILKETDLPYVIENVPGSPLKPSLILCGTQFELKNAEGTKALRRHRIFETNWRIRSPEKPCDHSLPPIWAAGHNPNAAYVELYGPCTLQERREAHGVDWMNRDELGESIPPAFTKFIGDQLITHIGRIKEGE